MIAGVYVILFAGWAALTGGMVLSFLYSGLETGSYAVNKIRLDLRAESDRPGAHRARRLLAMHSRPGRALIVLLIGNNLANYLASAGMVMILTGAGWVHADWYSVAILTPVIFIFCELLPKNLFHHHGETLVYVFSGFLDFSRRVFTALGLVGLIRVLMWLVMKLTGRRLGRHDGPLVRAQFVSGILAEGQAGGALTQTQSLIAERVVNISNVRTRDVMVPLNEAVLVDESVKTGQIRELLHQHGHPRFGVYSGQRDNIIGVLNAYDVLLDESGSAPSVHIKPALELPENLGVIEALVRLQRRGEVMGLVVSPTDRCVGVVTIKDLVEEIVGELEQW